MIKLGELAVFLYRHYCVVVVLRCQLNLFYLFRKTTFVFKAAKRPRDRIFKSLVEFPLPEEELSVLLLGKSFLKV